MDTLHSLRPTPGTATGRVWEIADDLTRRTRARARRADVIAAYVAQGGNAHTANTQFQQWKAEFERRGLPRLDDLRISLQLKEGGRLLLPAELRAALKVAEGDTLTAHIVDGELRLLPQATALRRARDLVRRSVPPGTKLVDALIQDRRAEAAREDKP